MLSYSSTKEIYYLSPPSHRKLKKTGKRECIPYPTQPHVTVDATWQSLSSVADPYPYKSALILVSWIRIRERRANTISSFIRPKDWGTCRPWIINNKYIRVYVMF
jgi:hypothetical protein